MDSSADNQKTNAHPASLSADELLEQCKVEHTRRKGPGGQHRNKVETAVVLFHETTGVSAEANEKRSQAENKKEAAFRLRLNLAVEIRQSRTLKSELLKGRIQNSKVSINSRHEDFPSVLAEILDNIWSVNFEIPEAAKDLDITGSQLLKFLKLFPPAFEYFNRERQKRGLPRIKF